MYILNLLRALLPPPSIEPPTRLPCYTSLILLHALRGVFYPSNFTFPLTSRFVLQRPELDTNDVPMLYSMLYSSSDDWRKERGWIVRFLSDGMMSTDDWKVLRRRHTWELLSSLFQSSPRDRPVRNGILQVLANLTSNSQATMSLVLKSGLLTWIEMELMDAANEERIAWVKILENILIVANHGKLESSTNGEWRSIYSRCLCLLLGDGSCELPSFFLLNTA
jgi:nucleolar pre-ribosomal-associated protein 1